MFNTIFIILIAILILGYIFEQILNWLNLKHILPSLPDELKDIFDKEEYRKSQFYKKDNIRFSFLTSTVSTIVVLVVFFLGGFGWLSNQLSGLTSHYVLFVLLFFGTIAFVADLLSTPFSAYDTFVIEERYGFNRTSIKTFVLDKLKGWLLGLLIGGGLLSLITWIFQLTGQWFWLLAWGAVTIFSLFMTMFYSNLIVPLFNKQTPLEDGELRQTIESFAARVGFKLDNIFLMDGSKRSSKANAYFTGLGPKKRIVLYDTLINDLTADEIVSVLAHEIGHYKKRHTTKGLILSTIQTGITLYLFSLFVGNDAFSRALGGEQASFHLGLIAFGILYSPISTSLGIGFNAISRRNEYQADHYAGVHHNPEVLISALKKLSKNNLINLTPHPAYVFIHYSHPPLLQRIIALRNRSK
ncbi:MAG: M48 family metallopeptidase [Bacteroidales bacterium]|nr:M48 family metallopeptidase [Bacteroidales bacterium]